MADKTKAIALTAGIFILLSTLGTLYFINEGDNVYYCEDKNVVGICFKLSQPNTLGIRRNCYYNESSPRKYKVCSTGWIPYKEEVKGNETILPDEIERVSIKYDFAKKTDAEDYLDTLKSRTYEYKIVRKEAKPYSNEIEIFYKVVIYLDDKILYEETISSKVLDNETNVKGILDKHALDFSQNWKPELRIKVE